MSHVACPVVDLYGPAMSYVALAPVDGFSGPVTFSAPFENVAPVLAVASAQALSDESCHEEHRGATEVPAVSIRLHAERVLRGRAARQVYFFSHTAHGDRTTARAEATYDALRSQRKSVAGDTGFFSLYEEELGGTRPDRLAGVRPQVRVQRHTLEHVADVCPSVQTLDTMLSEQVIDVTKISQDSIQQRLVDRDFRHPQMAEQLVEVPTVLSSFLACRAAR